jgi:hypothetical protein
MNCLDLCYCNPHRGRASVKQHNHTAVLFVVERGVGA